MSVRESRADIQPSALLGVPRKAPTRLRNGLAGWALRGRPAAVALTSGVMLGAAFEPLAWPYVMPLAVAGFVLSVRSMRPRAAWWPGFLFGAGFMLTLLWWLWESIGVEAWLALGTAQALWFAALGPAMALTRALPGWPIWSAALWSAVESLRGAWPLGGFPWGRLAFAVIDTPWQAGLPHIGATGVGFAVALLGCTLAWACTAAPRRRPAAGLVLLGTATLTMAPAVFPAALPTRQGAVNVAVVQGNVPGAGNELAAHHRQVTRNHLEATLELAADVRDARVLQPDFVVWPENSTAVDPFADGTARGHLERAAAAVTAPLLVGAMVDAPSPRNVLNQGVVWDPITGPGERYTKRHPVPFGEYVPLRWLFAGRIARFDAIPRDMLAGTRDVPLTVAGVEVADVICFDVAYDDGITDQIRNGAQMLVVQTSNATFINTAQIQQQFAISRIRALETGRSTAIAATNGISAILGPDGVPLAEAPPKTKAALVATVPLREDVTTAMWIGPGFGYLTGIAGASAVVVAACRPCREGAGKRLYYRR